MYRALNLAKYYNLVDQLYIMHLLVSKSY